MYRCTGSAGKISRRIGVKLAAASGLYSYRCQHIFFQLTVLAGIQKSQFLHYCIVHDYGVLQQQRTEFLHTLPRGVCGAVVSCCQAPYAHSRKLLQLLKNAMGPPHDNFLEAWPRRTGRHQCINAPTRQRTNAPMHPPTDLSLFPRFRHATYALE
ncbi:hypothetical protein T440DRAFT_233505 [Plenodomus tracheiphilus IPT5]|uniref:Uncharacterized protein n=1 Tax=Plenodomus tracheiphilus IPT5 TaxID=1408161 RepID=A0A6A7ASX1_9PLEO|nr:hypothetical protein T440DRAFT_233505 [Plenodomus tracheiphilus IPT5]